MGATDLKAVDFLFSLENAEIRVSFDTRRTRLHAKAYIIHRDSGFGVAYIGSSNLSPDAVDYRNLRWQGAEYATEDLDKKFLGCV